MLSTISIFVFVVVTVAFVHESNGQVIDAAMQAAAPNDKKVGQLNFNILGQARGNDPKNWAASGTVGIGTKVWESQNGKASIGVGAAYGQSGGRENGQFWNTKPQVGAAVGVRYKFGRK